MKYFFIIFLVLLISFTGTIPYWTGLVAHQQLPLFNKRLSNDIPAKFSGDHYEQGWFHSSAESTFTVETPLLKAHPFTLHHKIDHGFLPAQPPRIQSVLAANLPNCAPELLKLNTTFQITGEGSSIIEISPCRFSFENGLIQWQTLQGKTQFVQDLSNVSGELQSQEIQVQSAETQVTAQKVTLQYLLEQKFLTKLTLMGAALQIIDQVAVKLKPFQLNIHTEKTAGYLTVAVTADSQQAFVQTDNYGPAYVDFSVQHLHFDTLRTIQATLHSLQSQNVSSLQQNFLLASVLTQQVPTLLKHTPELVVSRLNFHPQQGKVASQLRVKMETFDNSALFNPVALTQMLTVQFKLLLPQAMLKHLAHWSLDYQGINSTSEAIEQRVQFWLAEEYFIPALEPANHYQMQLESTAGILQINEKKLLWQEVLGH